MFLSLYTAKVNFLKAKSLQGFDVAIKKDALQTVALELFNHNFGNVKQAEKALNSRYRSRLIDLYRKNDKLDFVADFFGHIVPEQPKENKINPVLLAKRAEHLLSNNDFEVFTLFLDGWTGSEIGEILKVKKAAISRRLSRIIDKLKLDEHFIELTEVALIT